jgi:hypothetical protein
LTIACVVDSGFLPGHPPIISADAEHMGDRKKEQGFVVDFTIIKGKIENSCPNCGIYNSHKIIPKAIKVFFINVRSTDQNAIALLYPGCDRKSLNIPPRDRFTRIKPTTCKSGRLV